MALYIPQNILHLARSLYVRPETYGPSYVQSTKFRLDNVSTYRPVETESGFEEVEFL